MDICATGLRIKINALNERDNSKSLCSPNDAQITPFHNIAVWSAVKFVISEADGGAAFLPLITDPENIDKGSLFLPLRLVVYCNYFAFLILILFYFLAPLRKSVWQPLHRMHQSLRWL